MRLERIIIIAAVAGLIFSATGCAITTGSEESAQADEIVQDLPSDSGDNPFFAPSADENEDDDGDATVVDDPDTDPGKEISGDVVEVGFLTEVSDVEGISFKAGEETVSLIIEVMGGSGEGFTWTHDMPAGFEIVPYNAKQSKIQIKGTPAEAIAGNHTVTLTATDVAGDGQSAGLTFNLVVESMIAVIASPATISNECTEEVTVEVINEENYNNQTPGVFEVPLYSEREIQYRVTGGKPPYTWTWQSQVKDSFHCHTPDYTNPYATPEQNLKIKEERYVPMPPSAAEEYCHGEGYAAEWTTNPTWEPTNVLRRIDDDEPISSITTQGDTITLKGEFIYDGPLPVAGSYKDKDPVEVLVVTVKDSCPPKINVGDGQGGGNYMPIFDMGKSVVRQFEILYPNDAGKKVHADISYRELNTYGDTPNMKIRLQGPKPAGSDGQEGETLAVGELELSGLGACDNKTCYEDFDIDWEDEEFGIDDVVHVKVSFGLGVKQIAHQAMWGDGHIGAWSEFKYGDMNVRDIDIRTTHWKLGYDDEDHGDKMNNDNGQKDPVFITNSSGVKFKRRAYPDTFIDKWND